MTGVTNTTHDDCMSRGYGIVLAGMYTQVFWSCIASPWSEQMLFLMCEACGKQCRSSGGLQLHWRYCKSIEDRGRPFSRPTKRRRRRSPDEHRDDNAWDASHERESPVSTQTQTQPDKAEKDEQHCCVGRFRPFEFKASRASSYQYASTPNVTIPI